MSFLWSAYALFILLLKLYGLYILTYMLYYRVYDYYKARKFYESQDGVEMCHGALPFLGNLFTCFKAIQLGREKGDNSFLLKQVLDYSVGQHASSGDSHQSVKSWVFFNTSAALNTYDPRVVEAMYTTKNKYFNKHPLIRDVSYILTGDSILFAETNDEWRASRKALTPAFYKGKLVSMLEIAKQAIRKTVKSLKKHVDANGPKAEIDIMEAISTMMARIMLMCALGEDITDQSIDYWEGGKLLRKSMAFSLRETFQLLLNRLTYPHIFLFPQLTKVFITPSERDMMRNALLLRARIEEICERRRKLIQAKDPEIMKKNDFLTILLQNKHFEDNNKRLVDECLTFFFAGSQTSAIATQNLLFSLIKHPEYQQKILDELDEKVV